MLLAAVLGVGACGGQGRSRPADVGEVPAGAVAPAPPTGPQPDAPGPTGLDGDVPIGYAPSPAGAAAAATSYLSTLHRLVFVDQAGRETALRRMAAAGADAVVRDGLEAMRALDQLLDEAKSTDPQSRTLLREVPIAYRVGQGNDHQVRVDVWSVGVVLIGGRSAASEVWSTNSVQLVWEQGDWHVAWWGRASGPVPAAGRQEPTPPDQVLQAVAGWEGYRYVPGT
ncbi:MAG: hypothetical protein ACRDYF_10400 [Acidimicrobiia bacterium]